MSRKNKKRNNSHNHQSQSQEEKEALSQNLHQGDMAQKSDEQGEQDTDNSGADSEQMHIHSDQSNQDAEQGNLSSEHQESQEETRKSTRNESSGGLETALQEEKAKYLRLLADFDNFKKRKEEEFKSFQFSAIEKLVKELINFYDSMKIGLSSIPQDSEWRESFEKTFNGFVSILSKNGVNFVSPAKGDDFDANFCEALMSEDAENQKDKDKIIEVYQEGIMLNNKVLRPARVKVTV
jgi:molecular chaperone GrpE